MFLAQKPIKVIHIFCKRKKAIYKCINNLSSGDIAIIAGKGHEKFQEINNKKIPFDDIQILKKYLKHN